MQKSDISKILINTRSARIERVRDLAIGHRASAQRQGRFPQKKHLPIRLPVPCLPRDLRLRGGGGEEGRPL